MRIANIAHRGGGSLAPENSLAAAQKALEIGADLWEADIAVTADGELILMHDISLARTSDAEKLFPEREPWMVTTFTLEEIHQLDLGARFIETDPFGQIAAGAVTPGELMALVCTKIPTVRQAILFTKEANWRVNLELKTIPPPMEDFPIVNRVLALIDEVGLRADRIVISSFNHDWLRQIQRLNPVITVQALVFDLDIAEQAVFGTYNAKIDFMDEEKVRAAAAKGVAVNIFAVNEEDDMRRFIAAGASGLITDFPQTLRRVLDD